MEGCGRLECCECASSVGADGPQRAALLLPCQHVLHVSCVEYIRRRQRLLQSLRSSAEEDKEAGLSCSTHCCDASDDTLVCPGCHEVVHVVIPLFVPSTSEKAQSEAAADAAAQFQLTHKAQKKSLSALRHMLEQRKYITELGHRCAALHNMRDEYLRELDKFNKIFPSLLPLEDNKTGPTSHETSVVSALALGKMTATELELYVAQTTPILNNLQAALRKERHAMEKRRQRLQVLKSQYHTTRQIIALDGQNAAVQHKGVVADDKKKSSSCQTAATALLPQQTVPPSPPLKKRKRERAVVIDVDEVARGRTPFIVDDDCLQPAEPHEPAAQSAAPTTAALPEVIDCDNSDNDDDDEVEEVVGPYSPLSSHGHDDADASTAPFLIPCGALPSHTAKVHINHIRMLPRREDRLWQPSLSFDAQA